MDRAELIDQAQEALEQGASLRNLPLPVHIELPKLARALKNGHDLEAALERQLWERGLTGTLVGRLVTLLKENEHAWLVLDALDQVPEEEWPQLREWLEKIEGWKVRVVLTCRTARDRREAIPWRDVTEYELAPLDRHRVRMLVERWFGDGQDLWEVLEENGSLLEVCRSPLVAAIVCLVHQAQGLVQGVRQGDLYDQAVRMLIEQPWRRRPGAGGDNVVLGQRIAVLQESAWRLFHLRPEANDFGRREAQEAIRKAVRDLRHSLKAHELLRRFMEAGILQEAGWEREEVRLSFLHRSFLEYLAGRALARKAETEWNRWKELIDCKAWPPAWWETLVFMGWAMRDPEPLLQLLAEHAKDDHFRHRLVLALRVLAERSQDEAGILWNERKWRQWAERLVEEPWPIWLKMRWVLRLMPAEASEILLELLRHEDPNVRRAAAEVPGELKLSHPRVVDALVGRLKDEYWAVRRAAANALGWTP